MDCFAIYMCEEIVIEILSRLPTKSLIRSMAVCRLWKSIITSPQFRLASKPPTKLLVLTDRRCYSLLEEDDQEENRRLMFETDFPLERYSYDSVRVIGSDNGLLCIGITNPFRVIIWNPFIRKHVITPDNPNNLIDHLASGFGGTISGGDYKYVGVVQPCDGGNSSLGAPFFRQNNTNRKKAVDIYSLKAGTWRRKYLLDSDITQGMAGGISRTCALLRGRLHWICGQRIFSFELEDEVFEDNIMLPESIHSPGVQFSVTVIRESLAVINIIDLDFFYTTVCVWVMEEYGDVNTWIKLFDIVLEECTYVESNMLHLIKDDELLLGLRLILKNPTKVKLVTCNPKTMKTRELRGGGSLSSMSGAGGFASYYKESLVLLGDHRAVEIQPTLQVL